VIVILNRRRLLAAFGRAAAVWPRTARAQQTEKMRRVGVLLAQAEHDPLAIARVSTFAEALQDLGWREGSNVRLERRFAAGSIDRMRALAKELFDLPVDVLVSNAAQPIIDVREEARTKTAIVFTMAHSVSLVELGLISNMSHPGWNMTGFTTFEPPIVGKWLELLMAVAPGVTRVGFMFNPEASRSTLKDWLHQLEVAASSLAVEPSALPVHDLTEMTSAVVALGYEQGSGLLVLPDTFTVANYPKIDALALQHRLPACYPYRYFVVEGGLMSYGPNGAQVFRQAASYVDRILRGANPGDLPIQQPNAFELVINLKIAKALGLTVPPWLLARADEVIE
jgi:putative tryptophan/tyrosine transport system substrate-binding protein